MKKSKRQINYNHLLHEFDQPWHRPVLLQEYSRKIREKGAPLENCFGFIDGTVRPICRPGVNQRILYNGHKRVHSIKFQSAVIPNGLRSNVFDPYEGKKHNMLRHSGLLEQLQQHAQTPNREPVCSMVIQSTPCESIYKLLLGVILIHCRKNSILK